MSKFSYLEFFSHKNSEILLKIKNIETIITHENDRSNDGLIVDLGYFCPNKKISYINSSTKRVKIIESFY